MSACPSAPYQPKSGKGLFNFLYSSILGARQYIISSTIRLLGKCILFGTRHLLPEMTVWFESPGIRENNQSGKRIQDFQLPGHQTWSLSDWLVPGSGGKHLMKCRISVAAEEARVIWIEGSPWGKRRKSSKPRNDLGQREKTINPKVVAAMLVIDCQYLIWIQPSSCSKGMLVLCLSQCRTATKVIFPKVSSILWAIFRHFTHI